MYIIKEKNNKWILIKKGSKSKVGIGMGYVKTEYAKKENIIYINIREKLQPAKIV